MHVHVAQFLKHFLCDVQTAVDTLLMMITSSIHDMTYAVVVKYVKVRTYVVACTSVHVVSLLVVSYSWENLLQLVMISNSRCHLQTCAKYVN